MSGSIAGIILVGHGGIPKGYPSNFVTKLKQLEAQRRAARLKMSEEEYKLDQKIRLWPRTPETDPYQAGLELVAKHLKPLLNGAHFSTPYNEFCTPTLSEAIEKQISDGVTEITVVSTMFTPGGSHSEDEIPEELEELRKKHPNVTLTYAWPFNLKKVAEMLVEQINCFQRQEVGKN